MSKPTIIGELSGISGQLSVCIMMIRYVNIKSHKITEKLTKALEMSFFLCYLTIEQKYYFNGAF